MKISKTKTAIVLLFFAYSQWTQAQYLSASDTSESSVKRYTDIINNYREQVKFIEYTLAKKGVPRHMRNLALIESHFNKNTTSSAGAVGVWQFMPAHANQYGLSTSDRNDIYKSTQVAAVSLSNLYRKYNNWVTVVAAYNCGEGNIAKAMQAANSSQYHIYSPYLPNETINHVQKYLNACYATGELPSVIADYNNSRMKTIFIKGNGGNQNEDALTETEINASFNLRIIAEEIGLDFSQLLSWNPGIEEKLANDGESKLYLSTDKMPDFLYKKSKILVRSINQAP
ncbi:lytic transglycosylase domain-containing protein [Chryseobacterium sp.]|uniref:lytic transglycosylase domain-containing protein n=1 Tax=Chryseobacterium sp. TaxID=1871047 RepID=UPI00388E4376